MLGRKGAQARWRPVEPPAIPEPMPAPMPEDPSFPSELKARVRAQTLETLSRLEEENARGKNVDGAKLDRLASALERLAELERVLDGRPGPGNRRPPREDPPAPRPTAAPRPPAIPTPASPTTPRALEPPEPPAPRLLSEPPEF